MSRDLGIVVRSGQTGVTRTNTECHRTTVVARHSHLKSDRLNKGKIKLFSKTTALNCTI